MGKISSKHWIVSFQQAMQDLGNRGGYRPQYFVEPCAEHSECVRIQLRRQDEHIHWTDHSAIETARLIANRAH